MSKNLEKEIASYVESKLDHDLFSPRTANVVRAVLRTLAPHFDNPYRAYKELKKRGLALYTIKTYFNYAIPFEESVWNTKRYAEYLQRNKQAFKNCYKDKTRILRPDELEKFLAMYLQTNPEMYNLLILMGTAGLRISEALSVSWEDVQNGFLKVIGKGNKQRLVPFNTMSLLGKKKEGKIIGRVAYRFYFKRDLKPFTPHDFRAHYATYIANHPELNIKDAAMLLGHNSITTTSRYVRTDLDRVAKVLSKS